MYDKSSMLAYDIWLRTIMAYCQVQNIENARNCQVLQILSNVKQIILLYRIFFKSSKLYN